MEREAVVAYLVSLTDEDREAVLAEANHRHYPFHRRKWSNGEIFCARFFGEESPFYEIMKVDDVTIAMENVIKFHRADQEEDSYWVDDHSTRID